MFDIGFIELVLIGVVGLVVIGPERLPGVASKLGRWVGRTRHFIGNVKRDIDREIRQENIRQALDRDAGLDEIKNIINDTKYTIEDEVNEAKRDFAVKARDDDPGRESSSDQNRLISEQEGDFDIADYAKKNTDHEDNFDDEDYGLTDHTDYALSDDEIDKKIATERHDGQDDKSNG